MPDELEKYKPWMQSQLSINHKTGEIRGWNMYAFFKELDDKGVEYAMRFDIPKSNDTTVAFEFTFRHSVKDQNVIIGAIKKHLAYKLIEPKRR